MLPRPFRCNPLGKQALCVRRDAGLPPLWLGPLCSSHVAKKSKGSFLLVYIATHPWIIAAGHRGLACTMETLMETQAYEVFVMIHIPSVRTHEEEE